MRKITCIVLLIFALTLGVVSTASAQTASATVTGITLPLNVRTAPTTSAGIVAAISSGMTYTVTGRLSDSSWWEIYLTPANVTGWVSGQFITVTNAHTVPVKAAPPATGAGFATATIRAYVLNVRVIPNPYSGAVLTTVPRGQVHVILGKSNGATTWYNIRLADGTSGWINGNYATIENAGLVPVTYTEPGIPATPVPTAVFGTVVNVYYLNVRSTPNPYIQNVLTVIARNQTYQVVGKNSAGTWYQLNVNGIVGWVNGRYLSVPNSHTLPVTF